MFDSLTSLLALPVLLSFSSASPSPQFYPLFHNPPLPFPNQFHAQRRDSAPNGNQPPTFQVHHNNYSLPTQHNLDPLTGPAAAEAFKIDVPRQVFGLPPPAYPQNTGYPQGFGNPQGYQQGSAFPQGSGLPQIYRVDNLIIIANPNQPQPCIPQRPSYPRPPGNDPMNRGPASDEPSKCTWAIVACCSPGNSDVRYNCFELLGCSGFFFDDSACSPRIVMAAAKAALDYYRGSDNRTASAGDNAGTNGGTNAGTNGGTNAGPDGGTNSGTINNRI